LRPSTGHLERQIREFNPALVSVSVQRMPGNPGTSGWRLSRLESSMREGNGCSHTPGVTTVVAAMVGVAGSNGSGRCSGGQDDAWPIKEPLSRGALVMPLLEKTVPAFSVDSEHSASGNVWPAHRRFPVTDFPHGQRWSFPRQKRATWLK
jgi:1-deoxy-D-xylulose 5-phosphate reductoisomerase